MTADEIVGGDGFAFAPTAATTWASCDGTRTAPAGVHELFQLEDPHRETAASDHPPRSICRAHKGSRRSGLSCQVRVGWEAGIRAKSQRANGEPRDALETCRPANERAERAKWLGVRDDFRNWVLTAA
jgi:hypothetical protein